MEKKGVSRKEVEENISKMGDYVRIDYLSRCLKKEIDFDTKKFILVRLAGIYEERAMYGEAAKLFRISAEINTTFQGKINDFVKSAEMFIKANDFDEADVSFTRGGALGNTEQKLSIKLFKKQFYYTYALDCLKKDKRSHAVKVYEKLLELNLDSIEKKRAEETLLDLYQKLGKIREYGMLKRSIEG